MTERKYIYSKETALRMIAKAVERFGANETTDPLGYKGGGPGRRETFRFVEHKQPFHKGKFRKVGFCE